MPFEIAPREVKVGRFQAFADAMLRGCAVTRPARGVLYSEALRDWLPFFQPRACAMGALRVGMGRDPSYGGWWADEIELQVAYFEKYGRPLMFDNDTVGIPREQIAALVAAL